MRIITVTQSNKAESQSLLEQFKILQKEHLNHNIAAVLDFALWQGDALFLLANDQDKVLAGALLRKHERHLKDDFSLPKDAGRVGFVYGLAASADKAAGMTPGLTLQKKMNEAFRDKAGAFADVDIIAANVVQQNLLSWHQASKEAGLNTVLRTDEAKGVVGKRVFFVAATAGAARNLIPRGRESCALTGDAIAEEAHRWLVDSKKKNPSRLKKARAQRNQAGTGRE